MLTVLLIKKNKFQRLNASSCLSLVFLPCTTYLYYLVIEAKPPETLISIKRQKSSCTCVILFISLLTHQCLDLRGILGCSHQSTILSGTRSGSLGLLGGSPL